MLSHLGSGAQNTLADVEAALGGDAVPDGFHQSVWDRWNAMSPREQADQYLAADAELVARFGPSAPTSGRTRGCRSAAYLIR